MSEGGRVRVGVIGCGKVAERGHLPALQRVPEAEVVALADLDPGRLNRLGDRFGVARRYAEAGQLLAEADIEAVAVCVPAVAHVPVASAVLDAGKHLLLEKPLALSLGECDQLIERASRSAGLAMMGFNLRWHRLVRRARDLIGQGVLGSIRMIRSVFASQGPDLAQAPGWRFARERGGGDLVDAAVHYFDLWRFLLGAEVEEVAAMSRSGDSEDEAAAIVARLEGGVLGSASFVERTSTRHDVEVYGSAGGLEIDCCRFDGLRVHRLSDRPGHLRVRLAGLAHALGELPRALRRRGSMGDSGASFQAEWRHFIGCIRRGAQPECTLTDGRRALQVALAAAESASVGRAVRVAEAPDRIAPASRPARQ